jgi:putative hydrolase of the HAD superfamily
MILKTVIFDLDNTLYDQSDYCFGAFGYIAGFIEKETGIISEKTLNFMKMLYIDKGPLYKHLFDDLISSFKIKKIRKKALIDKFHGYEPSLHLEETVVELLDNLKVKYLLGLVTNGEGGMQRRKVKSLGLDHWMDAIVYTDDYGIKYAKPHELGYKVICKTLGIEPLEVVYVGDNPHCDFQGANHVGITTIRVMNGPFVDLKASDKQTPNYEINNISALEEKINELLYMR